MVSYCGGAGLEEVFGIEMSDVSSSIPHSQEVDNVSSLKRESMDEMQSE